MKSTKGEAQKGWSVAFCDAHSAAPPSLARARALATNPKDIIVDELAETVVLPLPSLR